MKNGLQNLLAYAYMCYTGKTRLDRVQNDIHQTLVLIGFITLIVLAILGGVALCFLIKPPEYYSTPLAVIV